MKLKVIISILFVFTALFLTAQTKPAPNETKPKTEAKKEAKPHPKKVVTTSTKKAEAKNVAKKGDAKKAEAKKDAKKPDAKKEVNGKEDKHSGS